MARFINAKIFLTDVDPVTGRMRPQDLIECIKINKIKKINSVVIMHHGGLPCDMKNFNLLRKKYKFNIIEDACHALGAKYNNRPIGYISDFTTFSFQAIKHFTTGDGGMTPEERGQSKHLVYQLLPSRYGMNPDDLRKADAIEIVIGQGAKPGGGGMLLGQKISDRVAEMRTLPKGIDQRSACRHPDWTGPDDLKIKILELREITKWQVHILQI